MTLFQPLNIQVSLEQSQLLKKSIYLALLTFYEKPKTKNQTNKIKKGIKSKKINAIPGNIKFIYFI